MKANFRVRPDGEIRIEISTDTDLENELLARFEELRREGGGIWVMSGGSSHGCCGEVIGRNVVIAPRPRQHASTDDGQPEKTPIAQAAAEALDR